MEMKQTPLYELCLKEGARMVTFNGWELPMQFSGVVQEHHSVREKAGLFDISHMGVLRIKGNNPKDALQALLPSDLHRIGPGEACYSVFLNEHGGILDDLIVYDLGEDQNGAYNLLLVINAGCYEKDLAFLKKHLVPEGIAVSDAKGNGVLLALQGPDSSKFIEQLTEESITSLPRFGHQTIFIQGSESNNQEPIFIARTGYTGENGFELLLSAKQGQQVWKRLINEGITPCGLGARDTLRLEAAMHLYGNDLNTDTTPFEAGLGWLVHLEMPSSFMGRDALEAQAKEGIKHKLVGLQLEGRGIARKGYRVFDHTKPVGEITSGSWSPSLSEAIALAYVPIELSEVGTSLAVEIRSKQYPAKVVKRPFYRKGL